MIGQRGQIANIGALDHDNTWVLAQFPGQLAIAHINAVNSGSAMLEQFRQRLAGSSLVRDIRGRGLMIGIELTREANQLKQAALERGVLINVTQDRVVRLLPPLIIDDGQAEEIIDVVCAVIGELG